MACLATASLLAALICSLTPALRVPLGIGALGGRRGTATARHVRFRNGLVIAEISVALVLVVAAGLFVQSLRNLRAIDLGFEASQVLTLNAAVDEARRRQFLDAPLERVRHQPGVRSAAAMYLCPLELGSIGMDTTVLLEGQRPPPALDVEKNPTLVWEAVTPDYFRTMGVRIFWPRGSRLGHSGDILRLVVRGGFVLAGIGIAVALVLTLQVTGFLRSLLFEVKPLEPVLLAAAVGVFVGVAALASFIPARRATRVDPAVSLRAEEEQRYRPRAAGYGRCQGPQSKQGPQPAARSPLPLALSHWPSSPRLCLSPPPRDSRIASRPPAPN